MKYVSGAFGALVVALSLAACGGGGGGGGGSSGGGGMPPTPTPESAAYSGSENIVTTYSSYPPATPGDPNVTPYPNTNITYGLSDSVQTTKGSGSVAATDTVTEPNETLTETVVTSVASAQNGSVTNVAETKTAYSDSDGFTQTITYPTPLVIDQEPENNGATWTNRASKVSVEQYDDGTNINRTTNADGSYYEVEYNANQAYNNRATVNSDGSGSWVANNTGFLGNIYSEFAFAAPSAGSSTFTGTYTSYACTTYTLCGTTTQNVGIFFATSPVVLWSDNSTITTGVNFPASCSVPSSYGTSGNDINTQTSSIDPLFGVSETIVTNAYTSTSAGLVCVLSTDTLKTFYDWNRDEYYFLAFSPPNAPFVDAVAKTTLTLQSGTGIGVASESRRAVGSTAIASAADPIALASTILSGEQVRFRTNVRKRILARFISRHPNGVMPR